jgi:hypothetical protein
MNIALTIVISTLLMIVSVVSLASMIESDYTMYKSASACVQSHVIEGVPRNSIHTYRGTCYVKPIL